MTDFRDKLERNERGFCDRIHFGDLAISIQCSEFSYCSPRRDGLPFDQYTEMEVATFYRDQWCVIRAFEHHYEHHSWDIEDDEELPSTSVCGYMDVNDIQSLYDFVKALSKDEDKHAEEIILLPDTRR